MLLKVMLCFWLLVLKTIFAAVSLYHIPSDCLNPVGELFETAHISSFVDPNRYIRLNISWGHPLANFSDFKMNVATNCSSIYVDTMSVDERYVIEPETNHPAEPPTHGCKYDVELFTENNFENCYKQALSYQIPECVDTVCDCNATISPFTLDHIVHFKGNKFKVQFEKTQRIIDIDLESMFATVQIKNGNADHLIRAEHIEFLNKENAFLIPLLFYQRGKSYMVKVDLQLDNCWYFFQKELTVPIEKETELMKNKVVYIGIFIILLVTTIIFYFNFTKKVRLFKELKKFLPFLRPPPNMTTYTQEMTPKITKELINAQYTPLEFILNPQKYDKYEFPRNKIVCKNEVGGGAFGKVYKAEVYELFGKPGYSIVAVKKPIENAPPVEVSDFLLEIDTMKKIANAGGHRNVIQFLACVTIDFPYIMIMELASCGSLKGYLANLRKEWEKRKNKRRQQHFFPDNMDIESYLSSNNPLNQATAEPTERLKYSDLIFEGKDETGSSGTESYIMPDTPKSIPSSPESPNGISIRPHIRKKPSNLPKTKNSRNSRLSVSDRTSPVTPGSISSGLPSGTETVITLLDSPFTPLINIREEEDEHVRPVLDSDELQSFSLQIANGMAYLENLNITHRDLAARNILMNENKVLKISDFGMARAGIYVSTAQKRQPLRWMAPEAIENRCCNNKTDVWSFGVVLWEIASLGAFPYKELSNEQVINHIHQGKRLERPETCTDQVYNLMQKCWQQTPDDRPSFEEIVKDLDPSKGKIYVDFSKISPKYVFPPIQETND